MPHRLQISSPDGERSSYTLSGDRISIGRASDNDLSYPEDAGLSRHHLILERRGSVWFVLDPGSKNGTLLNDERINGQEELQPGDRVRASRLSLVFELEEPQPSEGTVIFDPSKLTAERPPMHTVTLGELVSREGGVQAERDPSTQWADPVTALLRAGRELVARKPVARLFGDILELTLEAVGANRGVLMTLDGDELRVRASRGKEFRISAAVRDRVMEERTSLLVGDVQSDDLLKNRQSIVLHQVQSLMAAPLQTDERVLGLIYVDSPFAWRQFAPPDLNLLTVMANVAAMRIERERLVAVEREQALMERDLKQAAEIQQQLLPRKAPVIEGLDLAGYNVPCHGVGGDYYDFLTLEDGRLLVALGDVAGKGMPASLLMVNLQARVQSLAERADPPAVTVTSLNRALHAACPDNRFVTFFLAYVEPASGKVVFCNAGHNPPMLLRTNGEVETLEGGGPVLGAFPSLRFQEEVTQLEPGETLVIYSDGITEATTEDEEEFGEERLERILRESSGVSADDLVRRIYSDVQEFIDGAPAADDVTIVVVRRV